MRISGALALSAVVGSAAAFAPQSKVGQLTTSSALGMVNDRWDAYLVAPPAGGSPGPTPEGSCGSVPPTDFELFPTGTFTKWETLQGGGTVRTYQIPPWAERVQYTLKSGGRPMKATVNLWIGPLRQVHNLKVDFMNGAETPYSGVLKFKKLAPVLKISTGDDLQLPIECSVSVPSAEFSKQLATNYDTVWDMADGQQKLTVQGGHTDGSGGGAVRSWDIPEGVDQVQLLGWSRDVGKKSFRAKVEVLRGPNNKRQEFELQCGGSTQPYHGVIQTPGSGWKVRIKDLKFVEDGKIQYALLPYEGNVPGFMGGANGSPSSGSWWN